MINYNLYFYFFESPIASKFAASAFRLEGGASATPTTDCPSLVLNDDANSCPKNVANKLIKDYSTLFKSLFFLGDCLGKYACWVGSRKACCELLDVVILAII